MGTVGVQTAPVAVAAPAREVDRARVLESLSELDDGKARGSVVQLEEMAAVTDQITRDESDGLATESRSARVLDQRVAGDLGQARLGARPVRPVTWASWGTGRGSRLRSSGG